MNWFTKLMGFSEESPDQARSHIALEGTKLISRVNGRVLDAGVLDILSLGQLREQAVHCHPGLGKLTAREWVGDVQQLHRSVDNADALFQVASQFNLLEMVSPSVTPEQGVGIYERDRTQGPACAIAAGAGIIYRNYFVPVNGTVGQTSVNQIDCLSDVGLALGNESGRLWEMRNGYALPSREGLQEITEKLSALNDSSLDNLRAKLKIGIQSNTAVTLGDCDHRVSQAYCSALPVSYSSLAPSLWEPFARLVLEAAYEATFCAATVNYEKTGNNKVFLTLLGGGAFGNQPEWIFDAVTRAAQLYKEVPLDVVFVSYGTSNNLVQKLVSSIERL